MTPLDMRLVATVGTLTRLSRLEDSVVAHREALQALARELADCAREAARLERMLTCSPPLRAGIPSFLGASCFNESAHGVQRPNSFRNGAFTRAANPEPPNPTGSHDSRQAFTSGSSSPRSEFGPPMGKTVVPACKESKKERPIPGLNAGAGGLRKRVTTLVLPALREARDAALETGAKAAAELDSIVRSHRQ